MSAASWFNLCEAFLWAAVAAVLLIARRRATPRARPWLAFLAMAFLCFGATDVAEIWTGTWAEPPALLVANVLCVVCIAMGLWRVRVTMPKPEDSQ